MNSEYYNQIATSTAHRKSRDFNKNFIFNAPEYLKNLIEIAFNSNDKNHHKACWILELVCEEKMELFSPYIDVFCDALHVFTCDSAIRSISKIGLFLVKNKNIHFTQKQEEQIIESYLDWIINSKKAANFAYAARTLYFLGKKHSWVNEELKVLLSRCCSHQTPGYRYVVKDLLKKLTNVK